MPHAYPMMLDVSDRLVVIVGGGSVAARKATGLIECGATRVRCVAPTFHASLPAAVQRVEAKYDAKQLEGAALVFAATDDPSVNEQIVRDARSRNILVNRADADNEPPGDFITPAKFREADGAVTVTVSAGSPALGVLIRDEIARRWDPRWSKMAEVMKELRPMIVARHDIAEGRRRGMFHDLASVEALDVLAADGTAALRDWLNARFPELKRQ
jgi:precorrin-2 dehydrogenase / sirohydrochlorin ferrochelatase